MKRIVIMAYWNAAFRNEDLGKDCGLVPYLFGRRYGNEVTLVTGPGEEYTYTKLMPELKLYYLPDNSEEAKRKYLEEHGSDIDLLMLYGLTYHNLVSADTIRRVNPSCKITCALDMNIEYVDRIPAYESPFYEYFDGMTLMWQSDGRITEFLNNKWDWNIVCARNGYYNLPKKTSDVEYVPFDERDNTIIYVGRINNKQKALKTLLEAFVEAMDQLGDWKLKMIGTVDEEFGEIVATFLDYYPELNDRLIMTGRIDSKEDLHREYEKAKIFATSTNVEGGTPNALAEAVCTGCVMAITQIDAYKDIIGEDEAGLSVPIGDREAFSQMLIKLCNDPDLERMGKAAFERGKQIYNLEAIVDDLYGKIFDRGF